MDINVTVTVQDDQGNSINASGVVTQTQPTDALTVTSPLTFSPQSAPIGTARMATIAVESSLGRPLTATIEATGFTFTPETPAVNGNVTTFTWNTTI